MPEKIIKSNTQTFATFGSNEVFDSDLRLKHIKPEKKVIKTKENKILRHI